ncbi:MAG: radical SAM family heme chaperone HemW [Bacteroidota bacterium]
MAGIYLHIPFCRRKCHYCNFFSLASQKWKEPFLHALKKEIVQNRDYLYDEPVNTVYFGGGTPSLYRPGELQEIIEMVIPDTSSRGEGSGINQEITLELNPEDVTEDYVAVLKHTWFNRFSLGVQSFSDKELTYLNRSHSAGQAVQAVKLLQMSGYQNISIDLIYGIPFSTPVEWQKTLETAFSLGVPHISAYALTIEQGTPLAWMIGKQKSAPVNEELQVDQYRMLIKKTKESGYLQYEISNFCKPGRHAIHNTNYWNGVPYLGLGPSAHSYNGNSRRWNISNLTKYLENIETGECNYEEELLTTSQKYNEYVMTSIRTIWGCDEKTILDFGFTIYNLFKKSVLPLIEKDLLREDSGVYFLTDEGKLFADRVASELFLSD